MQQPFAAAGFPARVKPLPFLGFAVLSQTGMSLVQQGLVILGTFFAIHYHLTFAQLGFVTTALSLGLMVSMTFAGIGVDRLGPRLVLFWGALLMAGLCTTLTAAQSYGTLLLLLFLVGMALAVAPSAGTKAVFTAFADRPRGLVMGIRQTGVPFGAALAAWLLPLVVPKWGLPHVYLLFALELLCSGWLFASVMQPRQRARTMAAPVRLQRADWMRLLRPALVAFFLVAGQYVLLTYSLSDLHQEHHLTLATAGAVLALSQLGGGAGRIVFGQVSDRLGGRRPPVIAFAAAGGGVLAFVVGLLPATVPLLVLFPLWTAFGFCAVGWNALVLTWAGESVPPARSGFAMSITGSIVFLGSSVFPPVFGFLVDASHHLASGWWMLAGVLFLAAAIAWWSSTRSSTYRLVDDVRPHSA